MAMTGTFYGATGNAWIKPKIEWSARENIEGNYSEVTATLYYTRTNSGYTTYGHWGGSLTINGNTKQSSGIYLQIKDGGYTAAITHTVQVPHGEDGTKTITISATGSISNTTLTYTTISGQVTLEAIPRASTISATNADIGAVSMVTVGRRSELYTHTVAYQFGSLRGYLTANGISSSAVKLTQTSIPFTLPETFYQQIPNTPTGVCTLSCTTYHGNAVVGSSQQTSFTVRANPEKCGPTLSAQAVDTNSVTIALTGNSAKAVRYASNMGCTLTCQARFGASVVEKKIADTVITADTLTISGIETAAIRFSVRDSRGYTAQTTLTPALISYYQPTGKLTVTRVDATGGKANLQAEGSWFSGSFGAKRNSLQLQYRINGGSWKSVSPVLDGDHYTASTQLTGLTYTSAHKIELQITDSIHSLLLSTQVNPGVPVFDWGQQDFQFHVPVTAPKITGLSDPSDTSDAVNKTYADTKLSRKGGTMEGNLNMAAYQLTGLQTPINDTDAATKNYADGKLSFALIWENKSPTSTFPAQSISVEALPNYTHIAIESVSTCGSGKLLPVNIVRKYTNFYLGGVVCGDNGYVAREITSVSGKVITFGSAYHGPYEDNNWVVPVKIYGVKGVAM